MEKWIAGHEGDYSVTTDGEVFSFIKGYRKRLKSGKVHGHLVVDIRANGCGSSYYVHHLVLTTFVSCKPNGLECRHLDGNPKNNVISNLAWGTRRENTFDKARHGGKINCKQKLIFSEVLRVRNGSEKIKDLAKEFNVTRSCLYKIRAGKNRLYF